LSHESNEVQKGADVETDFGLLSYSTDNIGDDIQSLAARQFLPRVDRLIDRDHIGSFEGARPTKVICNGWFMHSRGEGGTYHWPPGSSIRPLFVAFHCHHEKLISENIAYFENWEPIGCREPLTREIFHHHGIRSYDSGCLTLTLRRPNVRVGNEIVFVDPFGCVGRFQYPLPGDDDFQIELWERIPRGIRSSARFLSHEVDWGFAPPGQRFLLAEKLVRTYAGSRFVVTSRLHCALPCLAMGVPVLLLLNRRTAADPRLEGLRDILNVMHLDDFLDHCHAEDFFVPRENPGNHLDLARDLEATCRDFIGY
jgi:hypothetical protein